MTILQKLPIIFQSQVASKFDF